MIEFGVERLKRGLAMKVIEILALANHCECRFGKVIDHEIWVSGELAVV
jgi:hypothetical protein